MANFFFDLKVSDATVDQTNADPGTNSAAVLPGSQTLSVDGVDLTVSVPLFMFPTTGATVIVTNGATLDTPDLLFATTGADQIPGKLLIDGTSSATVNQFTGPVPNGGTVKLNVEFGGDGDGSFTYVSSGITSPIMINGMSAGDSIHVPNATFMQFNYDPTSETGTVHFVSGALPVTMSIQGMPASVGNVIAADPQSYFTNGDFVMPVCFLKGTRLRTPRGDVAIEALQAGDQVWGQSGWRTVKWIGWRKYRVALLRTDDERAATLPIRIRQHAFAASMPDADLLVSPWHHLWLDGVLVRARCLINGRTIVQEPRTEWVEYYHVELDQFDVVIAHGVYSESWADGGNRDFFQNVAVSELRPQDRKRRRADRPGFAVLRDPVAEAALREKYAARAMSLPSVEAPIAVANG
ncbi:Hint domain-containing protein [Bordetella muralis]|uniref:Hint domain-containing protein n=1 Tax=Bordetella muralis TaxID=1649130 RepID=UPI0039F0E87A